MSREYAKRHYLFRRADLIDFGDDLPGGFTFTMIGPAAAIGHLVHLAQKAAQGVLHLLGFPDRALAKLQHGTAALAAVVVLAFSAHFLTCQDRKSTRLNSSP